MPASAQTSLHVALNAHLLSGRDSYRSAGIHHYILHLLRYLSSLSDGIRLTALVGADAVAPDTPVRLVRSSQNTDQVWRRVLWEQVIQPRALGRIAVDVVHGPAFVGPLVSPCPVVITIHDLSFIRFPQLFHRANRIYLTVMSRLSARRCSQVIAVSEHTARETEELLGVNRRRITVVYHGVDPRFRPLPADKIAAFRERRGLPEQFVLFVGTLEPRKNLKRLVEAFAQLQPSGIGLVLAGGKGWLYEDLFARVDRLGLHEVVLFPGYVSQDELALWYNAATVFAYPSVYEGFGMPVTEAQACGTPVMTSSTTSLPEAAGEAAILVDPYDVGAIAAGLRQLVEDEDLRQHLGEQGLTHARHFNWTQTAQETVQVYRKAAE